MNAPHTLHPQVEVFFFDADPGTRFSIYHAPDPLQATRGAILYVHPFAEEMNLSRRMASLQARAFAEMGFAVLQIDLFGCGDSCGDFSSARWHLWKRDLDVARAWLAERCPGPMYLWGLRLGGLLALDFACGAPVQGIILWQPFLRGQAAIGQFLREQLASAARARQDDEAESTASLHERFGAGGTIEVGGYALPAELVQAIDACDAADMPVPSCPIHWFAGTGPAPAQLDASARRLAARWQSRGAALHLHTVQGAVPFWAAGESAQCPALLAATRACFEVAPP
jgi:exosortase A-associated hydrolase 2